jgi:hypothetical protein
MDGFCRSRPGGDSRPRLSKWWVCFELLGAESALWPSDREKEPDGLLDAIDSFLRTREGPVL